MSQDLGAGPGGKQGPCTAEQVVAPKGGQRAARWQSYDPALLVVAPEQGRCRGRGMEGRQLPFHHTVSLPLFLFVLALLACLQLALGLAALILGGQGPCWRSSLRWGDTDSQQGLERRFLRIFFAFSPILFSLLVFSFCSGAFLHSLSTFSTLCSFPLSAFIIV